MAVLYGWVWGVGAWKSFVSSGLINLCAHCTRICVADILCVRFSSDINTGGDIWCWSTINIFIVGSYRTQSQTNYVSKWEDNILKDIKSFTCPCTNWTTNEQETVRTSKAGKYSIIIIIIITIIIKIRKMDSYMNDVFHLTNIFIL